MANSITKIQAEAERALKATGATNVPVNPEYVAESLGVEVIYFDEPTTDGPEKVLKDVAGFYDCQQKKIFVNKSNNVRDKIFTIAHELGHHLLHSEYSKSDRYVVLPKFKDIETDVQPIEEKEADNFALFLLMPKKSLNKYQKIISTSELSDLFAVKPEHMKERLILAK